MRLQHQNFILICNIFSTFPCIFTFAGNTIMLSGGFEITFDMKSPWLRSTAGWPTFNWVEKFVLENEWLCTMIYFIDKVGTNLLMFASSSEGYFPGAGFRSISLREENEKQEGIEIQFSLEVVFIHFNSTLRSFMNTSVVNRKISFDGWGKLSLRLFGATFLNNHCPMILQRIRQQEFTAKAEIAKICTNFVDTALEQEDCFTSYNLNSHFWKFN